MHRICRLKREQPVAVKMLLNARINVRLGCGWGAVGVRLGYGCGVAAPCLGG